MAVQLANRANRKINYDLWIAAQMYQRGGSYGTEASNIISQFPGILSGVWDDDEPTSEEWIAYVDNVVFGVWDDNEPTGTPTPSDTPVYTIWDDSEVTT
jgi:hypothetical protein